MKFFRGVFSFAIMLILGTCLMLWLSFKIMGDTVLSPETNSELLAETSFSNELVSGVMDKYHMNTGQLQLNEYDLMKFVNDSGYGVINYVFLDTETMPSVDVSFIKTYIEEKIEDEIRKSLDGKLDVADYVSTVRQVKDGESISAFTSDYFKLNDIEVPKEQMDNVILQYMGNRDEADDVIVEKITKSIARENININSMKTELSLQELFDRLMDKNPFTIMKDFMEVFNKDVNDYLFIMIILLTLLIIVTEFRIRAISVWLMLSLLIAIIPLQLLRLVNFFMDKDFLGLFDGMSIYIEFMMEEAVKRLNVITIIALILIIIAFVTSKIIDKRNSSDSRVSDEKPKKRFKTVRAVGLVVLFFVIYSNFNSALDLNTKFYEDVSEIHESDFQIGSIDLTLKDLLEVEYDF